jgi:cell division protein FtsL
MKIGALRKNGAAQGSGGAALRKDGTARWIGWGVLVYAMVAGSGIAVAAQSQYVRDLFAALERTQEQQDELLSEYSRLLLERSTLASYQNIDQIAEQSLAMRFPELVERVDPERGSAATSPAAQPRDRQP